jgi:CRISPR-associated exonuclease Cas4
MPKRQFDWSALRRPGPAAGSEDSVSGPPSRIPFADVEGKATDDFSPLDGPPAPPPLDREPIALQPNGVEIRVNDIKQFAYCPRIVFYRYTMPVEQRATFKMEHGKSVEPRVEDLEKRRRLREYGLAEGTRRFQVPMRSRRLGVSGRIDLLIETPDGMFPVDFKDTTAPIRHNHHVQLCAYAMLIEDAFHGPVRVGFIYRVPRNDVTAVEMSPALRAETLATIEAIRALIRSERLPDATTVRSRCTDCEYRNYCGDVF